jgi:hypothetical protein
MDCSGELRYESKETMIGLASAWDKLPLEIRNMNIFELSMYVDAVKTMEAQPAIPYKYPYTIKTESTVMCDKYSTLPAGVTIPMMKKQLNELYKIAKLEQPFTDKNKKEEYTYDYTIFYIIFVILVAFTIMYKMSSASTNSLYQKPEYNGVSEYYTNY